MSYFNGTNMTNGDFTDILLYSNTVTGDWFGTFMLLGIFMVSFGSLKLRNFPLELCLPASSFLTAFTGYAFYIIGIVGLQIILLPTILFITSIFYIITRES